MSWNQYPGGGHHQQGGYGYRPPPPQWAQQGPPPPPNMGYRPPPPPQAYYNNPPPPQQYQRPAPQQNGYQQGGYQQQQQSQGNYRTSNGGYVPPTGAPVEASYHHTGAGYTPPSGTPQRTSAPYGAGAPIRPPSQAQHYGPQLQGQGGQSAQPYFQYSQCTGKKKALCIGINYVGSSSALAGCINDAHNVQKFLIERYGYKSEDIVMLTDDARNPRQIPTRANILAAMHWLVQGAQPNDSLFFHYSGHGGQTPDLDGDEDDGYDEVIYPLDFKTAGHIVDDDITDCKGRHNIMVRPLPAGCRLTAIYDSCHSGTALDLPYIYSTEGVIKEPNLLAEAGQGLLSAGMSYLRGDTGGMLQGIMGIGKKVMNQNSGAMEKARQTKTSPADVISWSGCKDSQTSADTQEAGRATGAMSYAFIAALTKYPQQSYVQLLNTIRDELKGKYDQKPQLSASHPMDTNILFIC
uniref:Metacaspase-1 n=1 Tax=Cryptococcus deneoformans (strain B-3501A) TaxID=283643 RepID=MCA1_CRYD3|nr:RecName: Full=Metacaspase-1; Flags: Precursor [Cryptococcus neoformans var. neoformans JEC21]P0CM59.1 RecName: Full=Metacaspase-1; Flags: Precursor [Cryptococcus neoformans var. neoformans B-3501A]